MANVIKYASPMNPMGNGKYIRPSFLCAKKFSVDERKDQTHPAACFTEKSPSLTRDGLFLLDGKTDIISGN